MAITAGADYLLVKGGSGLATLGEPDSAGVPAAIAETTLVVPYNDGYALEKIFGRAGQRDRRGDFRAGRRQHGLHSAGSVWLATLRTQTQNHGALLICDEVMTGFRVAWGGAQALYDIRPDLTCLGKIIGGGLPVGAYGGKREIMEKIAPLGPWFIKPAPSAAIHWRSPRASRRSSNCSGPASMKTSKTRAIRSRRCSSSTRAPPTSRSPSNAWARCSRRSFRDKPVRNWDEASDTDRDAFAKWHGALLDNGVYWPCSQFEAAFISLAHDAGFPAEDGPGIQGCLRRPLRR